MRELTMVKRWIKGMTVFLCAATLFIGGCTPQNAATAGSRGTGSGNYAVITDDAGRTVTLKDKPQRVVVLSTSLLNFVAAVDGNLAGRATVKSEVASIPEKYQTVPDVGPVYSVSTEKIIELKPDLVIASEIQHKELIPILEQNNIPVLALRTKTYDDVKRNLEVIGKVYGKEDTAKAKQAEMDAAIAAITDKLPHEHKKIAIIHATPSSVTVELPNSLAGDIAQLLHLDNVAAGAGTVQGDAEKIPYSMEALVEKNPDVIFFTSMGPSEKIQKRIKQDVESSPAWSSLKAVEEGSVYVLPENYFLLNPGLDYPKAVDYMARLVYPEVFQ
jgi:iron complex transport system substrate-binding protein